MTVLDVAQQYGLWHIGLSIANALQCGWENLSETACAECSFRAPSPRRSGSGVPPSQHLFGEGLRGEYVNMRIEVEEIAELDVLDDRALDAVLSLVAGQC
jgi:hypothetical protein